MSAKPGETPAGRGGRPWTAREDEFMRRDYQTLGGPEVQRRLTNNGFNRTLHAIHRRAARLHLQHEFARTNGLFPLALAHTRTRNGEVAGAHQAIIEAARADGVLTRDTKHPYPFLAPTDWVDAYMERLEAELADEQRKVRQWLTTVQAAAVLGVHPNTARAIITPSYQKDFALVRQCARIPRYRLKHKHGDLPCSTMLWDPEATEREARLYHLRRARKRLRRAAARTLGARS